MTFVVEKNHTVDHAVANAIGQLIHSRSWGDSVDLTLPIFYPSGSAVCLNVQQGRPGVFSLTDNGLAYREIEQVGGETFFSKNASALTEETCVWHDTREMLSEASYETLPAAIADLAAASSRLTWKVLAKVSRKGQAEIADYLFERLRHVFGSARVERAATIVGPSTREWHIDAVVHLENKNAIFQAVSNNHMSVYPTAAMFHDLALLDTPPATIAVVKNGQAMGSYFNILAQAGSVIEEHQTDQVYERAAEWTAI